MIYSGRESAVPPLGNCPPINAPGMPSTSAPMRTPATVGATAAVGSLGIFTESGKQQGTCNTPGHAADQRAFFPVRGLDVVGNAVARRAGSVERALFGLAPEQGWLRPATEVCAEA